MAQGAQASVAGVKARRTVFYTKNGRVRAVVTSAVTAAVSAGGSDHEKTGKGAGPSRAKRVVRTPRHVNADVVLTVVAEADTVPTRDLYDRAHSVRDAVGDGLMPNAVVGNHGKVFPLPGSTGRRYHASQLVGKRYIEREDGHRELVDGVGIDSSFDELRRLQAELDGIPGIGLNSGGGACTRSSSGASAQALADLVARRGYREAREMTRRPMWHGD